MIQKIIAKLCDEEDLGTDIQIERRFGAGESEIFVLLWKGRENPRRFYVKVVREDNFRAGTLMARLRAEYSCLQATYEYFKESPIFLALRPISFYPEWRAIVTAESPGVLLKPKVMSHTRMLSMHGTDGLKEILFQCGRWLRDFHDHVEAETEFEMEGITLYVSRRLEILEREGLITLGLGRILRKRLEEMEERCIHFLPSVLVHNDFIPGNILVDEGKICVLDFTWVGRGYAYFDIVAFWLELQNLGEAPQYSRGKIGDLQRSFLEGYGRVSEKSVEFRCFELLHRINTLVVLWRERQRKRWPLRIMREYEMMTQRRWLDRFQRETL